MYNELVKILGERPYGIKDQYKQFVTASGNPFTSGIDEAKTENSEGSSEEKVPPAEGEVESKVPPPTDSSAQASAPSPSP